MVDKRPDPDRIAEEAVGEALENRQPDAGKEEARPVPTSAGPQANVADKTAASVGERVGDAYADATPDEARERSRNVVRRAATRRAFVYRQFDHQTFITVVAAFALGYIAACWIDSAAEVL